MKTPNTQNEGGAASEEPRKLTIDKSFLSSTDEPHGVKLGAKMRALMAAQPEKSQRDEWCDKLRILDPKGYGKSEDYPWPPEPAQAKAKPRKVKLLFADPKAELAAVEIELERVKAERRSALDNLWTEQKRANELLAALKECLLCLTSDSDSEEQYASEIGKAQALLAKHEGRAQ